MNIFVLDHDVVLAARYHNDKHVVKMILESAQLLSTAHRVLDGTETVRQSASGRRQKHWELSDEREHKLYKATHINHPSAVWARRSHGNYMWLQSLAHSLCTEYTRRYGKVHKCQALIDSLSVLPNKIPLTGRTAFALAMPEKYKIETDPVTSYRNYYMGEKGRMATWNRGKDQPPYWWNVNW